MEVNIIKEKECKETDFEEISINQEQSPSTIVNETNEEKYIYMNFKSLLSGTVYTIQVISSNIIRTEIQPLYNKMSIDPQIQYLKLIFGGKLLEQDKTFDFYNLKDNHTIIVLVNNLEISNNNSSSNNSNTTRNNRNNNSNNSDSNIEVNEIELDVNPHSNENINNGINGNEDSNIDPVYIIRKNFFILILGILIGFAFADHSVLIVSTKFIIVI